MNNLLKKIEDPASALDVESGLKQIDTDFWVNLVLHGDRQLGKAITQGIGTNGPLRNVVLMAAQNVITGLVTEDAGLSQLGPNLPSVLRKMIDIINKSNLELVSYTNKTNDRLEKMDLSNAFPDSDSTGVLNLRTRCDTVT